MAFEQYLGKHWAGSDAQVYAFQDEVEKRSLFEYYRLKQAKEEARRHTPSIVRYVGWRKESITVRGKNQTRFRDTKTGRFVKKPS